MTTIDTAQTGTPRADSVSVPAVRATIGCLIPAHNEAESIRAAIGSVLDQSRLPDVVHVIVNNSTDNTAVFAEEFAGPHTRVVDGAEQYTSLYVHNIGTPGVVGTRSGALDYGFTLVEGYDCFFVLDADMVASPGDVAGIENEFRLDLANRTTRTTCTTHDTQS